MNKPKVSVLIPAYNHEMYLKDTIESVLNQTFPDFELLISDDCSTDNTAQVIKSFSDKRITGIFFEENKGTVRSLNHLLSLAKGEYIAVLGSDDIWELDKLEKQLQVLEQDKSIAACFTWVTLVDQASNVIHDETEFPTHIFEFKNRDKTSIIREIIDTGNHFCHSSVLIRSDIHRRVGEYNVAYRQLHDLDLWVRILLQYDIHIIEEPLVRYRYVPNSGNVSQNNEKNTNRLFNEAESIVTYLFENICDEDFLKCFSEEIVGQDVCTKVQIMCEKFLLLKQKKLWGSNNTSLAIDFLMRYLDDTLIQCFEKQYGLSLEELYSVTGEYKATYCAEEHLELKKLKGEWIQLKTQLDTILSSKSWKITKPLRILTRILKENKKDQDEK